MIIILASILIIDLNLSFSLCLLFLIILVWLILDQGFKPLIFRRRRSATKQSSDYLQEWKFPLQKALVYNIDVVKITKLEIHNVNYSVLQDILRKLPEVSIVQGIAYEFNDSVGKASIKHVGNSQKLVDQINLFTEDLEIILVTNSLIVLKVP